MKKINNYKLLFLVTFLALGSCAINDDEKVTGLDIAKVEASLNNPGIIAIPDISTTYNLAIDFKDDNSNTVTLNNLSRLKYLLNGKALETYVDAGVTSANIPLDFTTSSVNKVALSDLTIINSNPSLLTSSVKENEFVFVVKETAVAATLSWDENRDLDLDLDVMTPTWNWSGSTLDSSFGITNTEFVSSLIPDGNYALYINEFAFTADVPYTFEVITSTGVQTFSGVVTADGWMLWFTKVTDMGTGVISYTFYETDPS